MSSDSAITELVIITVKPDMTGNSPEITEMWSKFMPLLKSAPGCLDVYVGTGVEDPKHAILVVEWDSFDSHAALMNDAENYPKLVGLLPPIMDSITMNHVPFRPDSSKAWTAPVTEIAKFTLKESTTKDQWEEAWGAFAVQLENVQGMVAYAHGWGKEVENDLYLIVGWESVDAHIQGRAKAEGFTEALIKLRELRETSSMEHAVVKKQ